MCRKLGLIMLRFIVVTIALATARAAPASPLVSNLEAAKESIPLPTPTPAPLLALAPTLPPALGPILEPAPDSASSSSLPLARSPASSAKSLTTITEIKTPASTTKLTHLAAPVAAAPILSPLQVSSYAYSLPALTSFEVPAAHSTYSIEQHGYGIIY